MLRLAPCIVRLADPELAWLARRTELIDPKSLEWPWLVLPCRRSAVMLRDLLPITPCTIWHCKDVSDLHVVLSHADIPSIIPCVIMFDPALDPCTVTLGDPVTAALDRKIELTIPTPPEKPVDVLPERIPTEITRNRLLKTAP